MREAAAGDAEDWLRFALTQGVTPVGQRKLLAAFGGPAEALAASPSNVSRIAGDSVAAALRSGPDPTWVKQSLDWLQVSNRRHLLTLGDAGYPPALLQISDPPLLLFVEGKVERLSAPGLAIVGARSATPGGMRDAEAFARALSDAGLTIVSGLALGIDGAAHRGGLRGASSSLAVLACGLDRIYPSRHRDLAQRLSADGALISEFAIGTPPLAANFPRRNRVISGIARGCLVVEAALRSGSLITARLALEQGREVFAVPGSIHSPLSKGCHWLIKQGAKLVESANDILEELGMSGSASERFDASHNSLSPAEATLLAAMGFEPLDLDSICERAGLGPDAASALLLKLELEGYLTRLPGGAFQRMR